MLFERLFTRNKKRESTNRPTFSLQLDITNHCNLRCAHCYQRGNPQSDRELILGDWVNILEQFYELTTQLATNRTIFLSGGEPLTSPVWQNLISHIKNTDKNTNVSVLTNGTLLDDSIASFLKEFGVRVQISFDGPTAELHDHFRGKGSFEKAANGAGVLLNNNVPFTFQAVLQKQISDAIPTFFKLAKSLGANSMDFARLIPSVSVSDVDGCQFENMLTDHELRKTFEIILSSSESFKIPTNTSQPLWCLVDPALGHPSSAGFLGLTIGATGKIQLTSRIFEPIGDATEKNGISKAYFHSKLLKSLRAGKIRGCSKCEYFKKCRGDRNISYITCGDFLGPDEHCWHWRDNVSLKI